MKSSNTFVTQTSYLTKSKFAKQTVSQNGKSIVSSTRYFDKKAIKPETVQKASYKKRIPTPKKAIHKFYYIKQK